MGWFSSEPSGPSGPAPKPSSDGAYEAPDRTRRAQCWDSRDLFFSCLDKNDILDAVKDKSKAEQVCKEEHAEFQKNCASSWVEYFKKKRVADWQRDEALRELERQGAQQMVSTPQLGAPVQK